MGKDRRQRAAPGNYGLQIWEGRGQQNDPVKLRDGDAEP